LQFQFHQHKLSILDKNNFTCMPVFNFYIGQLFCISNPEHFSIHNTRCTLKWKAHCINKPPDAGCLSCPVNAVINFIPPQAVSCLALILPAPFRVTLQPLGFLLSPDTRVEQGVEAGLGGAFLSMVASNIYREGQTAGRGYMALAAMIFGKWQPVGALWACLLFGFLDAAAIRLQGVSLPGIGAVPVQAIQALPYVMTVVLLAGFIGRARAPKALGVPYAKTH
jgi:hypothetical protein